ncbi:hypothetical protein FOA52_006656 [Chlamydomonas sp. UWO 241]|nr:hypothetical protein FOA52_006656 [Chlamydomonas sp. UWO 241]
MSPSSPPSVVGTAPPGKKLEPLDAARLLHQALGELETLKRQIKQPFMAKATVQASIARMEDQLRAKTQHLVAASMESPPTPTAQAGSTLRMRPRVRALPPVQPTASQRIALFKADFVNRPTSDAARLYLSERFGVEAPTSPSSAAATGLIPQSPSNGGGGGRAGGGAASVARGLTPGNPPATILSREMRHDPAARVPPELTDRELARGLLHLVNAGLLDGRANLTPALCGTGGDGAPVQSGAAAMHAWQCQFDRPPPTTALEDSLLAAAGRPVKLDLLTPVVAPTRGKSTAGAGSLRAITVGGGNDNSGGGASGRTADGAASQSSPKRAPARDGIGAGARGFDSLMDNFSLHEFMIRMGRTIESTPEFESFKRTYEAFWDVISVLIRQLEALMTRFAVPIAVVDGKSLAELAQGVIAAERQPALQDLLLCLQNIQEVGSLLRQPGRRFRGQGGTDAAATAIQSAWRGLLARRKHSKAGIAAAAIQGAWRMHRLRGDLQEKLVVARSQRNARFQELQARLPQIWHQLQTNAHVIIHVPCLAPAIKPHTSPAVRDAVLATEAAQLARLCDLAEPLTEVLLLMPGPPDPDVMHYWDKILQVGGVDSPSSRYRVVWPANHARLPSHMGTTAKILSSPATMKRLRSAVSGRLAYMVPGLVGDEEVDLCVQLGVPLLAPAPTTAAALGRKSGARVLLADAGVIVPPGLVIVPRALAMPLAQTEGLGPNGATALQQGTRFEIREGGEVVAVEPGGRMASHSSSGGGVGSRRASMLAQAAGASSSAADDVDRVLGVMSEAMIRSPTATKWLLKMDDGCMGLTHACVDLQAVQGASAVLERVTSEASRSTSPQASASASAGVRPPSALPPHSQHSGALSEGQAVGAYRLRELLRRHLPHALVMASRDAAQGYSGYMRCLSERGGIVEAVPRRVVGSPCANLFVSPTGDSVLLSTHERIFVAPFRAVGSTFPQQSVPHCALHDAVLAVGAACFRAGVLGHVCVDFVAARDGSGGPAGMRTGSPGTSGQLRLWAVDITPCVTQSLLSFQLFDFLSAGQWDARAGRYTIDEFDACPSTWGTLPQPLPQGVEGGQAMPLETEPSVDEWARQAAAQEQQQQQQQEVQQEQQQQQQQQQGQRRGTASPPRDAMDGLHTGGTQQQASGAVAEAEAEVGASRGAAAAGAADTPHPSSCGATPEEGHRFDVDQRTGIILSLSERFTCGVLGLITVGLNHADMYDSMLRMLAFISQREAEVAGNSSAIPGSTVARRAPPLLSAGGQLAPYADVFALVKFMAARSAEARADSSTSGWQRQMLGFSGGR